MALQFRDVTVNFDPTSGGVQHEQATAVFDSQVLNATVALKGFNVTFDNGDHHVLQETIEASVFATNDNTVTVQVDFLLRDNSGNIDDPFSGSAAMLVLAEVA